MRVFFRQAVAIILRCQAKSNSKWLNYIKENISLYSDIEVMEKQNVSSRVRNFPLPCVEGSNLVTDCPDYRTSLDTKLEQTHSFRPFLDDSAPIWYVRSDVRQTTLCPQMIYQGIDRLNTARRKPVVKDNTGALKLWLIQHKRNPYPNKPEKIMLAILSKMTLTQVSTWFANARRRLKKEYPDEEFELIAESLQQNQHFTEH